MTVPGPIPKDTSVGYINFILMHRISGGEVDGWWITPRSVFGGVSAAVAYHEQGKKDEVYNFAKQFSGV